MNATHDVRVLKSFVRGELGWDALVELGAQLRFAPHGLHLEEPKDAPVYEPSITEVATGFVAHWAVGTTLQEWARVLLATAMIDLSCLEDHPDGDMLLEAIWDAAEAAEIDEERLVVARKLAAAS